MPSHIGEVAPLKCSFRLHQKDKLSWPLINTPNLVEHSALFKLIVAVVEKFVCIPEVCSLLSLCCCFVHAPDGRKTVINCCPVSRCAKSRRCVCPALTLPNAAPTTGLIATARCIGTVWADWTSLLLSLIPLIRWAASPRVWSLGPT